MMRITWCLERLVALVIITPIACGMLVPLGEGVSASARVVQTASGERHSLWAHPPDAETTVESVRAFVERSNRANVGTIIMLVKRMNGEIYWKGRRFLQAIAKTRAPLMEPFVMRDDFQGDSLAQWASYPPAQDIGYDPSLSPMTRDDVRGGRALVRIEQPTRRGPLRLGFIKRLTMAVSAAASVRFTYWVNAPVGGAELEIGLAGTDGTRYVARRPAATNAWTPLHLSLNEFRSHADHAPPIGVGLEAVYLLAHVTDANPDIVYRVAIDDVLLAASRQSRFVVRVPASASLDPWVDGLSAKTYRRAEPFRIEAAAPAPLVDAECTLTGPDGITIDSQALFDDGTHGDRIAADGVWSNDNVHTFRAADPSGVWIARLHGSTREGRTVDTSVRVLLRPVTVPPHPRLLFTGEERESLIAKTTEPRMGPIWTRLVDVAKRSRAGADLSHGGATFDLLDRINLLPTLLGYFDVINQARQRISHNALVAYLSDDAEARAATKSTLLAVAGWPRWAPPWFEAHGQHTYYPAGLLAVDVALGYDLLYSHLTEQERSTIRRALVQRAIAPTYREYVLDNRIMANTSNWLSHTVGGALMAAAAIADEVTPAESDDRFDLYVNGLLRKLEDHVAASYLPDGSYGEGISYLEFDLETLAPAVLALRRTFGVDYTRGGLISRALTYLLYTLAQPTSASLDMGDTHPPSGRTLAPLFQLTGDPSIRWLYDQFQHASLIDFIFFDDAVAPRRPTLDPSRVFAAKGNAVFRSGWGSDDAILLYRAGPNFNHNHADQGSFLLSAFGEALVTEAGWSDYYKDPYYRPFFTQAVGHNTVLVDGDPESQEIADTPQSAALDAYPRITDALTSEFYDGLGSELSSVYRGRLAGYTRRIVFVKPDYFVVYDQLRSAGGPRRFNWLLHVPDRARVTTSPSLTLSGGSKAALAIKFAVPAGVQPKVRDAHIPYPVFATRSPDRTPPQPAFLDVSHGEPATDAQFLALLVPARTADEAIPIRGAEHATTISTENWTGVATAWRDRRDLVMFRRMERNGRAQHAEWTTDAIAWMVSQMGSAITRVAMHAGRSLSRSGQPIIDSPEPIDLASRYDAREVEVVIHPAQSTEVRLFIGSPPVRVTIDEQQVSLGQASYDRASQTVRLIVPVGQHRVKIDLR